MKRPLSPKQEEKWIKFTEKLKRKQDFRSVNLSLTNQEKFISTLKKCAEHYLYARPLYDEWKTKVPTASKWFKKVQRSTSKLILLLEEASKEAFPKEYLEYDSTKDATYHQFQWVLRGRSKTQGKRHFLFTSFLDPLKDLNLWADVELISTQSPGRPPNTAEYILASWVIDCFEKFNLKPTGRRIEASSTESLFYFIVRGIWEIYEKPPPDIAYITASYFRIRKKKNKGINSRKK